MLVYLVTRGILWEKRNQPLAIVDTSTYQLYLSMGGACYIFNFEPKSCIPSESRPKSQNHTRAKFQTTLGT
jgi:hypothetical protein